MNEHARTRERWVVGAFAVVVAVTLWRHEMWRDELQAWMIAKASSTPHELLHNIRHEGHPVLWYVVVWPLTKLGFGPWVMQLLQFAIAVGTTAIVVFRAPWSLTQRTLYAGGYFALFEYGVLARSYALGAFLLMATLATAARIPRRWPVLGLLLAALALTSAFGAIAALALLAGLLVDDTARRRAGIGAGFVIIGLAIAYAQASPAADTQAFDRWHFAPDAHRASTALAAAARALVPIPKFQREFWNTSISDGHTAFAAIAGILLVIVIAWVWRGAPAALTVWLVGVAGVAAFIYTKVGNGNTMRYLGHIFLVFMAANWLAARAPRASERRAPRLLTVVLTIHVAVGVFAVGSDVARPWSDGQAVADYLRGHHLAHATIVASPDFAGSTVAALLDRPLYYAQGRRNGTFVLWDKRRDERVEPLLDAATRLGRASRSVLVLSNAPLHAAQLQLLRSWRDGIVIDEHFWLYRVNSTPRGR